MVDPYDFIGRLLREIAEEWDAHPDQGQPMPYLKRKRPTRRGRRAGQAPRPTVGQARRSPTLYFN